MAKKLLIIAGILVLLLVILGVITAFSLGSLVRTAVNQRGPALTGTPVALADASISPFTGSGSLSGLAIGNPDGWSEANALSLGEVRLDLRPLSLFGDPVVIEEMVIDRASVRYETRLVRSNLQDLLNNIERAIGPRPEDTPIAEEPRRFIVHHLLVQDAQVTVDAGVAGTSLTLPPIDLRDLGVAEGGITGQQLARIILRELLAQTARAAANSDAGQNILGNASRAAGEGLQRLLGGRRGTEKEAEPPPADN